jgi:hypothetical protein
MARGMVSLGRLVTVTHPLPSARAHRGCSYVQALPSPPLIFGIELRPASFPDVAQKLNSQAGALSFTRTTSRPDQARPPRLPGQPRPLDSIEYMF